VYTPYIKDKVFTVYAWSPLTSGYNIERYHCRLQLDHIIEIFVPCTVSRICHLAQYLMFQKHGNKAHHQNLRGMMVCLTSTIVHCRRPLESIMHRIEWNNDDKVTCLAHFHLVWNDCTNLDILLWNKPHPTWQLWIWCFHIIFKVGSVFHWSQVYLVQRF
jgi:hypothetical protein